MKIKKGQILQVTDSRKGIYIGKATKNFDTEKDEWYPIKLAQNEPVHGITESWSKGAEMTARRGLCQVELIEK